METVIRVVLIYFFLMVGLRVLGKRELAKLSPFELVTLMLIPEIVQQALVGEDFSLVNAAIALSTLFCLVFVMSIVTYRLPRAGRVVEGSPTVLVRDGHLFTDRLDAQRIAPEEVYGEMRSVGIASLDDVAWATLEPDGKMTFIPRATSTRLPPPSKAHASVSG